MKRTSKNTKKISTYKELEKHSDPNERYTYRDIILDKYIINRHNIIQISEENHLDLTEIFWFELSDELIDDLHNRQMLNLAVGGVIEKLGGQFKQIKTNENTR